MELYALMRNTHQKMTVLGQKAILPPSEDLRIMNVAKLTAEQLLQLCSVRQPDDKSHKAGKYSSIGTEVCGSELDYYISCRKHPEETCSTERVLRSSQWFLESANLNEPRVMEESLNHSHFHSEKPVPSSGTVRLNYYNIKNLSFLILPDHLTSSKTPLAVDMNKLYGMPSKLVATCEQTLFKRKEIIDWFESLKSEEKVL